MFTKLKCIFAKICKCKKNFKNHFSRCYKRYFLLKYSKLCIKKAK